jgi:DNA-binding transcriptional regulator GbsR (MarR family)
MELTPVTQRFVLHWGEMAARWGINRTVAQVHALLYISPQPLPADEIAATLEVARSNISTSLRELQSWGVVRVAHVLGDRRDHFESLKDVWEMFQVILDERKKREIDPTLAVLRQCVAEARTSRREDENTRQRLGELLGFVETISSWYEQVRTLPSGAMVKFVKMGSRLRKWLGVA